VDLQSVDQVADTAVRLGSGNPSMPYFQAAKAMSNYRLGHFSEAIDWAVKAENSSEADAQAKAYAVSAMADWQLGQKDAARAMLAEGNALAPSVSRLQSDEDIGDSWVAWLFARVSLDEAGGLITSGATTNGNSSQP
jgi:hypothetical protein